MRFRNLIFLILWTSFTLSACATVTPMKPEINGPIRSVNKSYKVHEPQEAYVGEEIIKVKDYWIKEITQNKMAALNDFTVKATLATQHGLKGEHFDIYGKSTVDSQIVYLIQFPQITDSRFGIKENGEWANFVVGGGLNQIQLSGFAQVIPKNTRFELVKETQVDTSHGFTNYEIVFNGITKDSINLMYREYTPDNMARPAFYQDLKYPIDTAIIRFKQIRIKVKAITNESISYIVLQDGEGTR